MQRLFKYKIYCETEQLWHFIWLEEDQPTPTTCPVDTEHVVDLDSVSVDTIRDPDMKTVEVSSMPAFASKILGDKKLFKRVVGTTAAVAPGNNTISYTCTFPWVKFMSIEFVNSEAMDNVCLSVYDDALGTFSTIPNFKLNTFGFNVNLSKDVYKHESEFDADLYAGMVIKITYTSVSSKTIGINFVMNEVK